MVTTQQYYLKNKEGEFCTKYSPNAYRIVLVEMGWNEKDAKNVASYYAEQVFIPTLERHRWLNKRYELSDRL